MTILIIISIFITLLISFKLLNLLSKRRMAKANINDVIYALDTFADGPNSDAIDLLFFYKLDDPELEKTRKQILSIIEEYPAEPGENLCNDDGFKLIEEIRNQLKTKQQAQSFT